MTDCGTWLFNPGDPCCDKKKCGKPCWSGDNTNLWIFNEVAGGLVYRQDPNALRGYWKPSRIEFDSDYVIQLDDEGVPIGIGPGRTAKQVFFRCSGREDNRYYYQIRYRTAYAPFRAVDGRRWSDDSWLTQGYLSVDDERFGDISTPLGDDPWVFEGASHDFVPPSITGPWYGDSVINAVKVQGVAVDKTVNNFNWAFDTSFHPIVGTPLMIEGLEFTLADVPPPIASPTSTFSLSRKAGDECCQTWCPACHTYVEKWVEVDGHRMWLTDVLSGAPRWSGISVIPYEITTRQTFTVISTPPAIGDGTRVSGGTLTYYMDLLFSCTENGNVLARNYLALGPTGDSSTSSGCTSPEFGFQAIEDVEQVRESSTTIPGTLGTLYSRDEFFTHVELPTSMTVKMFPIPKETRRMQCGTIPLPLGKDLRLTINGTQYVLKYKTGSWATDVIDSGTVFPDNRTRPGQGFLFGPNVGYPMGFRFSVNPEGIFAETVRLDLGVGGDFLTLWYAGSGNLNRPPSSSPPMTINALSSIPLLASISLKPVEHSNIPPALGSYGNIDFAFDFGFTDFTLTE